MAMTSMWIGTNNMNTTVTTEMKILEATSADDLTALINEYLEMDWKLAGNSYNVCRASSSALSYSILVMKTHVPADEEILNVYDK